MKKKDLNGAVENDELQSETGASKVQKATVELLELKVKELEEKLVEKDKDIERCDKLITDYKSKAESYLNTASYYKAESESNKKDFDRYKERNKNIETDAIKKANSAVAKKLLPVMDNFDHAMMAVSPDVMKGFVMIYSSIAEILKELGVAEIACKNQPLNPEFHNCIETIPTDDPEKDSIIASVYQKGYIFAESGEVIRPATVSVYKA